MTGTYFDELLFYNRTIGAKVPNGRDEAKRSPESFIASGKVNLKKSGAGKSFWGNATGAALNFCVFWEAFTK